jgi:hypothetical protein
MGLSATASKQVGDAEHVKVFATMDAAETWFEENDPEGRRLPEEEHVDGRLDPARL